MQRHLFVLLALAALAAPVHAQPAPAPPPNNPGEPVAPPPNNPGEPVAPPPDAPPPATERSAEAPPQPVDASPRRIAVAKDSPGAFFSPGLLMQTWVVYDLIRPTDAAGESVNLSTSTFRIR